MNFEPVLLNNATGNLVSYIIVLLCIIYIHQNWNEGKLHTSTEWMLSFSVCVCVCVCVIYVCALTCSLPRSSLSFLIFTYILSSRLNRIRSRGSSTVLVVCCWKL